jgi:hypothetical protein
MTGECWRIPIGDSDHAFLRLGIADYLQNSERAPLAQNIQWVLVKEEVKMD